MGKAASKHKNHLGDESCEEPNTNSIEGKKKHKRKDLLSSSFLKKKKKDKESFSKKRIEELFEQYKRVKEEEEVGEEMIGPNGVAQLLKDLGVGPDDVISFDFNF